MENQSKPNDLLVSLCWYTERYKEVLFFSVVILFLDSLFGVAVFRRVHPHHVDAGCQADVSMFPPRCWRYRICPLQAVTLA